MQTPTPSPAAPAPPAPPPAPAATTPSAAGAASASGAASATVGQAPAARPLSSQEVAQIRARRTELSNQLQSADSRRRRLSQEIRNADGRDRAGLEQRRAVLDERIMQLESDIAETGRLLTSAPAGLVATSSTPMEGRGPFGMDGDSMAAISGAFTLLVLAPLALASARLMWKRATAPPPSRTSPEVAQQLRGLEQAVDAIAVEMERVSEGQRFVTRLLAESPAHAPAAAAIGAARPALGVGQAPAEPVRVREEIPVPAPGRAG